MEQLDSLRFPLRPVEGWPPVSDECMPLQRTDSGYAVVVPPLFLKGLSVGDVIEVTLDGADAQVLHWRHVHRSEHSTIWMLVVKAEGSGGLRAVLDELRAIGCGTSEAERLGVYAVDVPADVSMAAVDALLADLDRSAIAVAFPSFRHVESER